MSIHLLEKLFHSFEDPLGEFYNLQKQALLSQGVLIDLTPLMHYKTNTGSFGGEEEHGFILLNHSYSRAKFYFSTNLASLIPTIAPMNSYHMSRNYMSHQRDFSYLLQMRNKFQYLCLFADEEYEVSLWCGNVPLSGRWEGDPLNRSTDPLNFMCDLPLAAVEEMLKFCGPLTVKITCKKFESHRAEYEKICSFEDTLNQCIYTFIDLLKNPHFYDTHFEHFNTNLKAFKVIKSVKTPKELFDKICQLNAGSFMHLDFFDWNELYIIFSLVGDFKNSFAPLRRELLANIKRIKKQKALIPNREFRLQ